MLELLGNLLGSAAGGGVVGLIGTGIHGWLKQGELRARMAHELALRKLDREEMRLEADLALRHAETEAAARIEVAEAQALTASFAHDAARYGGGWIDAVRGLMRPILTLYSLGLLTVIGSLLWRLVNGLDALPAEAMVALFEELVVAVVFLATTMSTWWFGSRGMRVTAEKGR